MESQLMQLSIFLEELKMKRNQVKQLDSELSRLSLRLIEKESELHAKTSYCHQLELKLAKSHQDVKKIGEDYGARLKAHQLESSRQEAAILDYAEKLRKVQMEKQCLALKIAHFEKEIKEVYSHVRTVLDSLPKLNNEQENLTESLRALENKQFKVIETCEMIQIFAGRVQKEAEGKWKMAQETRCNRAELEKKLCAAEAQLRVGEGERGKDDTAGLLRKQKESLNHQLEMSKKREDKLRADLGREREEKLVLQRKHEEVLNELAHYLSEQKEQPISPA
ncbi:structural maintenance of chromosomes protein 4-like [Daphnia pulex]|uniref:structural maintenance of chromosomes protein 4-like n=1 Tax=Daphnia pulex TaxID=6669 RepID=UPI001EDDCFDC|nr:structural maintenance of chromosomes protein 4-like [Daphnia pulex]